MESLLGLDPLHDVKQDLVIVVGKGKGSVDNISVLRPIVEELLQREFGIRAEVGEDNTGRLLVDPKSMKDFIAGRKMKEDATGLNRTHNIASSFRFAP
jgi:hypothetical protein